MSPEPMLNLQEKKATLINRQSNHSRYTQDGNYMRKILVIIPCNTVSTAAFGIESPTIL